MHSWEGCVLQRCLLLVMGTRQCPAAVMELQGETGIWMGALQHPTLTPAPDAACDKLLVGQGT